MSDVPASPANASPEAEIEALVRDLDVLLTAEAAATALVRHGSAAIEPLRRFLFDGRPSGVFQPRRWAVRALSALGAREILLEYLRRDHDVADREVRLGEEVVEGEAAQLLAASPDGEIVDALLTLARRRVIPGLLEALARLREPRAVPLFVHALEDDFSRPTAERALTDLDRLARDALVDAAMSKTPSRWDESGMSLRRRRSALQLLKATGLDSASWDRLRPTLDDRDVEVRVSASTLALAAGAPADVPRAVDVLLAAVPGAPWYLEVDIEDALVSYFTNRTPELVHRLGRFANEAPDPVARVLRRVRRRLPSH